MGKRGLTAPSIQRDVESFQLGYCADPLPGHEMFRGMLAIPYLRYSPVSKWSVVSMRFRCVDEECDHKSNGHGKYMSPPGSDTRLFNTLPLQSGAFSVGICEGELDALTATVSGIPSVGVSGAEVWLDHFAEPFRGFERVYLFADGDEAGKKFTSKLAKILPNSKVIPCEPGEDVNSEVLQFGKGHLLRKVRQ